MKTPFHSKVSFGKPIDGARQVNVGERRFLDLDTLYKSSERNVTIDNFFTSLELAMVLNTRNMT